MKRRFKVETGMDMSITLDVDLSKMTPELAEEINEFWALSSDVLSAANGDVIEAVARRAAGPLLVFLIEGYNGNGALQKLCKEEGWPPFAELGITVVDFDLPDLSADGFYVHEIKETS